MPCNTRTEESTLTLQSLGLKIDRNRGVASDPLQLAVEVHLALPFFLLEIILSAGSSCGGAVNSKGGYVNEICLALAEVFLFAVSLPCSSSLSHTMTHFSSISSYLFLSPTHACTTFASLSLFFSILTTSCN